MRMFSKGVMITMACATLGLGVTNAYALGLKNWNPITINGYMDNTACLKDMQASCGTFTITKKAQVFTGIPGVGAIGAVTFKDWKDSYFKLKDVPFMSTNGDLDLPGTGYKFVMSGKVKITQVYRTSGRDPNYRWYPCEGADSQSSMTIKEAAQGKQISCPNPDTESWLMGYEVELQLKAELHRTSQTPSTVRSLKVPTAGLIFMMKGKNQDGQSGAMQFDDVFIDGGTIRLNDRKCFINPQNIVVNFGTIPSIADRELRKETPTDIQVFCSGFTETIGTGDDAVIRDINGAGLTNTINSLTINAITLADGDTKRIALPDRTDLYVEVGQKTEGTCGTASVISVDGTQSIGRTGVNGPVWEKPGRQDEPPLRLYWRLCQKDIKQKLEAKPLTNKPAAILRLNYN